MDAKGSRELEHPLQLQSGCLEVGLVPSGEMGDVRQTQRGPCFMLHPPLAVTALDLEEFLAFYAGS